MCLLLCWSSGSTSLIWNADEVDRGGGDEEDWGGGIESSEQRFLQPGHDDEWQVETRPTVTLFTSYILHNVLCSPNVIHLCALNV